MVGGEDVLFRPVSHGHYTADKLIDGSIDLAFVMMCNEAIDIQFENERRSGVAQAAAVQQHRRRNGR